MEKMLNEGNQKHNLISSSGSGNVINYGSGSDFLTSYGSGCNSQKVPVPSITGSTTLFLRRAVPKTAPRRMGRVAPLKMNLRFSNQRSVELNMSSLGRSPRFPRPEPHR